MRIIAGEYRGRIIDMPKGASVRPTQDRVREAIFNIIRVSVPGSSVLDLYAGSGAFGLEAISRGAHMVVFIDNNIKCIKTIKANLSGIGIGPGSSQVFKREAASAIEKLESSGQKFDIAFLDPPYYKELAKNSLLKIEACDILSGRGFVIAEHFKTDEMPEKAGRLGLFEAKRYGDTVISFYKRYEAISLKP
ncbi:MAG: 16S rRNA (guanine(966)-N(2))-methyltransferase RsmD [Candidatus Omnitrophota bacterium]